MTELYSKCKNWFDKVYVEKIDVACLELPILKILVTNNKYDWLKRDELIDKLKRYGDFGRGSLSFDHLWSHRFGKGEESELLNALVEHDGQKAGDTKNKFRIKSEVNKNDLLKIIDIYNDEEIQKLINFRLEIINTKISNDQEELFYNLAKKHDLLSRQPVMHSDRTWYKIYPKYTLENEERDGCHYEFCLDKKSKTIGLFLHLEPNVHKKHELKKLLNLNSLQVLISDITDKSDEDIENIFKEMIDKYEHTIENFYLNIHKQGNDNMRNPLNQILYGPPGTGKTYHTIDKALEIIFQQNTYCGRKSEDPSQEFDIKQRKENSDCEFEIVKKSYQQALNDNDRNALKQIFDYYKDQGQIVFTTFHQSYGYEEFVEGIKPCDLDSCESGNTEIKYAINNGIFKQLCIDAQEIKATTTLENFDWNQNNIFKMSLGGKYDSGILEWCLDNGYISMGWGGNYDFSLNDVTSWEQYRDEFKEKIRDIVEEKDIKFTLQAMYAFQQWMKVNDLVFVSYGNKKIVAIGQIIGNYEYIDNSDINYFQFRKVKWLMIDRNGIQADRLLSRGLSQQTIYNINKDNIKKDFFDTLFDKSENLTKKNYVLIIDEINRGNISKIFGELITLIEDSKRIGKSEEIRVKLPYSGYDFGVPDNLYIIGTMNTADRSIALMDTALRRRFHFEEMMPDLTTLSEKDTTLSKEASEKSEPSTNDLKVDNINIRLMLKKINERIEYLYDRDHQIGHAYFMSLKDITDEERKKAELDNIFRNKIIPLLQEYFYDDWEKIQMVLGDHKNQNANQEHKFIQNTSTKEEDLFGFNHDDIEDEKTTFTINKPFSVSAYTKIYASNSNASKIDND